MNLSARDPAMMRTILEAVCRLPESVRRFVVERVVFVSLDDYSWNGQDFYTRGRAISPDQVADRWVIVLAPDAPASTIAHEVAHSFAEHEAGGADAEREAAQLARSWGFTGDAADPDSAVERYLDAAEEPMRIRARVSDAGALGFDCRACGCACAVLAPVVAAFNAVVGVECTTCRKAGLFEVAGVLKCPTCGERPAVTWETGATPQVPVARSVCTCSSVMLMIAPSVIDPEPIEPWMFYAHSARRVLAMNGDPAWARLQLRKALAAMDGDPHHADVQLALDALVRLDVAGAKQALAAVEQRP